MIQILLRVFFTMKTSRGQHRSNGWMSHHLAFVGTVVYIGGEDEDDDPYDIFMNPEETDNEVNLEEQNDGDGDGPILLRIEAQNTQSIHLRLETRKTKAL